MLRSDKHLSAVWDDAKWMYDTARKLYAPLMAGSSVPVTWRKPHVVLPKGCKLGGAVQIGYGPFSGRFGRKPVLLAGFFGGLAHYEPDRNPRAGHRLACRRARLMVA